MSDLLERASEIAAIESGVRRGEVALIEAGAGVGKTSLIEVACATARRDRRVVLRARGSDLERDFAYGLVRQLFERHCAGLASDERAALFSGPARPVATLFQREDSAGTESDTAFVILHGLYWLTVHLADRTPLLLAVDDAHWADDASLRWLAYLAARVDGPSVALVVALRPGERASESVAGLALRSAAVTVIQPSLLSEQAVADIVRRKLGKATEDRICALAHRATGGNPFYLREFVHALEKTGVGREARALEDIVRFGGVDALARQMNARLQNLDRSALRLAQAIAILGDGCELRQAAAAAGIAMDHATDLATQLVKLEVLGEDHPPRFIHPIVRHAVAQILSTSEQDVMHRAAARVLHAEAGPPGQIAAHLAPLHGVGDAWVVERLRDAAKVAIVEGVPTAAAALLERALIEPPFATIRKDVLREAARAQQLAGMEGAYRRLEEALTLADDQRERVQLALELAQAHAALFRWTDAVNVLERAVADASGEAATELESQLVAVGLQDARTAPRALRTMEHLSHLSLSGTAAQALSVAQGMVAILTGQPAEEAARPLMAALVSADTSVESWDMRAALLWSLVIAEQYRTVESALEALLAEATHSGSSRGLVAVHSTTALVKLKLGDLVRADSAARIALRIVQEGDFARGLPFAAAVLAEVATAAGQFDDAQALLDLLPQGGFPATVGTVLIPAARGRLRLAQGRAQEALDEFEMCIALWRPEIWGMPMRDVGYVHARAGAAQALLALGDARRARELAEAELSDTRQFGGNRALGISLRAAGLAQGGGGLALLEESVGALSGSSAQLEYASSLVEWGAALRRAGQRSKARLVLAQGLDFAARCPARPLVARAREELRVAGARPRRDWSVGVEALTPSELRIVRLARDGHTNRQIAQDLYVSIKTVEGHLARAYGKLGIDGRDELDHVLGPEKARVSTR